MEKRWDLFIQYILTYSFYIFRLYPFGFSCISLVFHPRFKKALCTYFWNTDGTGIEIDFANKLKRDQTAVYSRIFDKDFSNVSCLFLDFHLFPFHFYLLKNKNISRILKTTLKAKRDENIEICAQCLIYLTPFFSL